MITLDQLRVLSTLHKTGSFNKAAQALHRAQSAVTYAIKALEAELELELLDRSGYRAKLTPAGEMILRKGERMLAMADDMEALSDELREGWEPRLNLLIHGSLPIASLMPLLKEFLEGKHPTQVIMRIEILGGILEAIERHQPELVVVPLGAHGVPEAYDTASIGSAYWIPVASAGHELAAITGPVSREELSRHLHLIVSDSALAREPLRAIAPASEDQWYFPDFNSRLEGLRAGLGFAWMATHMVEDDIRQGRLVPIVVEGQNVYRYDVAIFYRRSPALGPTGRFLLDLLQRSPGFLPPAPKDILAVYPAG